MPADANSRRVGVIGIKPAPPPRSARHYAEFAAPARQGGPVKGRPPVSAFTGVLGVSELDDRGRPGLMWEAAACELGRSRIVLRSRRMCHQDRILLMALHLADDVPLVLYGTVHECVYDCDGLHRIDIDLDHVPPDTPAIQAWIDAL